MTLQALPRSGTPSIDDTVNWGKHRGITYRELAQRDRGYARWAATTIGGLKGQLCAEALAVALGVDDAKPENDALAIAAAALGVIP